jgi:hypothetical protein
MCIMERKQNLIMASEICPLTGMNIYYLPGFDDQETQEAILILLKAYRALYCPVWPDFDETESIRRWIYGEMVPVYYEILKTEHAGIYADILLGITELL